MINYNNLVVTAIKTEKDYYDKKKDKLVKYKKPVVTKKIINDKDYCFDLGELYEIIKFHTEKSSSYNTDVQFTFTTSIEY